MPSANVMTAGNATQGSDKPVRRLGRPLPLSQAIARVARSIWPSKTDIELSVRVGTTDRACRRLLAGGNVSGQTLQRLIQSEEGWEFLTAILGDASPAWRRRLERGADLARMRTEIERLRAQIAEMEAEHGRD